MNASNDNTATKGLRGWLLVPRSRSLRICSNLSLVRWPPFICLLPVSLNFPDPHGAAFSVQEGHVGRSPAANTLHNIKR